MRKLTERQYEVLVFMQTWLTYEEIATRMGLSKNTIRTHVQGIFRALEVSSRREAVACARKHGLLDAAK